MAKTMEKDDVKLEYDDITKVDWDEVKKTAGKAIPQLAKNVTADLCKQLKNKELKSPYGKVGLIGKDLYLRFKDGSKHLEDVLLVKDWTPPDGEAEQSPEYKKKVKDFIDSRKELFEAASTGEAIIKQQYVQLESLRGEVEKMAKTAETEAKTGTPDPKIIQQAAQYVAAAQRLLDLSQRRFNEGIHPLFERNRTVTKPDDVESIDVSDWGKSWFLQVVNPKYQKAQEYVRLGETAFNQIVAAKDAIDRWTLDSENKVENYASTAANILKVMKEEFERAEGVWGMSPIDNFAYGLSKDLESIERNVRENNWDLAQRTIDNAAGKSQKAADNYKQVGKHLAKVYDAAHGFDAIPKNIQKNVAVSGIADEIKEIVRRSKAYDKDCQAHLKEGLKIFVNIKKVQKPS